MQRPYRRGQGVTDLQRPWQGSTSSTATGWATPAASNLHALPRQVKALRERNSVVKRKASIIINNMSKLVLNPADAAPFLPRLLPEVKKVRAGQPSQMHRQDCACAFLLPQPASKRLRPSCARI